MTMKSWSATIKVSSDSIIVFDLDDTLYKEIDFLKSAYLEIAKYLDEDEWKLLYIQMFSLYRNGQNVFEFLSKKYEVGIDYLLSRYRNHFPKIKLSEGALTLLETIKKKNGKIAIITDGRSITQRNKINALGINNYLDTVLISEELGFSKPSKQAFKKLEDIYKNCSFTYVADNLKKDFIAPNALNWDSVYLIDDGLNIHVSQIDSLNPNNLAKKYVSSLNQIRII